MSSKRQRYVENKYSIPALQAEFRTRFNLWMFMILIFMIIQSIGLLLLASECPLLPFKFQDAGAKTKSIFAFLLIPLSQAMIDFGICYIASYVLKSLIPSAVGYGTLISVFFLSYLTTLLQLVFKVVDTKYDMLIALLFPIFKFLPFILAMRDSMNSALEFKNHLVHDRELN